MGFLDCDAWLHMLAENFDCSCFKYIYVWGPTVREFYEYGLILSIRHSCILCTMNGLGLFTIDFPSEFLLMS